MRKTDIPTYLIAEDRKNAGNYYRKISGITDFVMYKGEAELGIIMDAFQAFTFTNGQIHKSRYELLIELLTHGVLWKYYAGYSIRLTTITEKVLNCMNYLRTINNGSFKNQADRCKGWILTHFFPYGLDETDNKAAINVENYHKWLRWLNAGGEYYHEAHQLKNWYNFWKARPDEMKIEFPKILLFTSWFIDYCQDQLCEYTTTIPKFKNTLKTRRNREDMLQTGKRTGEYFLNMVGAEILNRAYRDEFLKCDDRTVFVPGCMRVGKGHNCKAVTGKSGISCAECNDQCNVYKINKEGKRKGYSVKILLHESNMFAHSSGSILPENCAIVGVACIPCLLAGGWKVRSQGLPVQCVLLNYSGCAKHWHPSGISTNLDMEQLNRVLAT
jgi:uncharacterized protein